ncbi:class II aldolase/adducin family protein [Dasania sp. GY-MA-18]|uniref:Class II aldolase/adducin family protein n=1 Tax=Dasania phycosphaerae TaxID=2950436 RepID=A0A9J6RJS4_9GAMM|nr:MULTISPECIES: class II aldolase/adducin family protein [Dasania]MCR8921809.1 class II aldolase/adducin family protein [Dasania sp. GY-MA-18]MCZ0864237.1 class II aldolase/adducin family protein [Dasania phycosphaerae]MCZ0867965.1 class II aldolase/adducin family protein [Dasania phycosphaerae]
MSETEQRQQLLHYAQQLNSSGLSLGKSGNISLRCEQGLLITPSAVAYDQLQPQDLVKIDYQGQAIGNNNYPPSSEWHFHAALYQQRPEHKAIVHAHPSYCTALACTQRNIPAFHYMVAIAGGSEIPLVPYALFGSEQLAQQILAGMQHYRACLLANHGMIACGENLSSAFALAIEVEALAQQYVLALSIGEVNYLTEQQIAAAIEQFKSYGKRD